MPAFKKINERLKDLKCQIKECCAAKCEVIPLTLSNTQPTTISQPGYYVVANSVDMPITGAKFATPNTTIIINSSDVTLDLCGHVLTGSGNKTAPFSASQGPSVPGGIQNDVRVDAAVCINVNPDGTDTSRLDNITITNGKIQYYSVNGIVANFVDNITITNCLIENCSSQTQRVAVPKMSTVGLFNCSQIKVDSIHFKDNRYVDVGVSNNITTAKNVSITNCTSKGLRGGSQGAINPAWLAMPDYVAYGIIGFSIFVIGTETSLIDNVLVENCNLDDIRIGVSLFGIYMDAFVNGVVIRGCNLTDLQQPLADITEYAGSTVASLLIELRGIAVEQYTQSALIENCTVQNGNMAIMKGLTTRPGNCYGFNLERCRGVVVRNCIASNMSSAGRVQLMQPVPVTPFGELVVENRATGFNLQLQTSKIISDSDFALNYQILNCSAYRINGGNNAANPNGPSGGFGFEGKDDDRTNPVTVKSFSGAFINCIAQDTFGSAASGGFAIDFAVETPGSKNTTNPTVFENCIAEHDRVHNPNVLSNGFKFTTHTNSLVMRNCTAVGHTLNGFDLAGYPIDALVGTANVSAGYGKFILDNCIANANTGFGFRLDNSLRYAELINCKSTNNGSDGINAAGRNMIFRNTVSDLNLGKGYYFEQYYPFIVKVETNGTNVGLQGIQDGAGNPLYGSNVPSGYTVQYVPGTPSLPQFFQYFNIIPNDHSASLPLALKINGIVINDGDIVLIKDMAGTGNLGAQTNGVYRATNIGGVVFGTTTVPVWQFIRLDPWRAPNIIPNGTKILVTSSNVMYTLTTGGPNVIVDTTPVPTIDFVASSPAPDASTILVDSCRAGENALNGLHNHAKDVVVRNTIADRNGAIGFLDDSVGGAQANANLYARNEAYNNDAGTTAGNFTFDYSGNAGVLLTGSITGGFPTGTVAPNANISTTPS